MFISHCRFLYSCLYQFKIQTNTHITHTYINKSSGASLLSHYFMGFPKPSLSFLKATPLPISQSFIRPLNHKFRPKHWPKATFDFHQGFGQSSYVPASIPFSIFYGENGNWSVKERKAIARLKPPTAPSVPIPWGRWSVHKHFHCELFLALPQSWTFFPPRCPLKRTLRDHVPQFKPYLVKESSSVIQ